MKREVWTKTGDFKAGHYQVMDLTRNMNIKGQSGGDIIKRLFVRVGDSAENLNEWKEDETLNRNKILHRKLTITKYKYYECKRTTIRKLY